MGGCSAVSTLNCQRMFGADWWHHEIISMSDDFEAMRVGLDSPSVMQIQKSDALSCFPFDAEKCDQLGDDWARMDVTKQLVDLKERRSDEKFVYIPCAYTAGITVFARKGTAAAKQLDEAPELPMRP